MIASWNFARSERRIQVIPVETGKLFAGDSEDSITQLCRQPESCISLKPINDWSNLPEVTRCFGLNQNSEESNGLQSQLECCLVTSAFVDQDGIGANLNGKRERGCFAGIQSRRTQKRLLNGGGGPLLNPDGKLQALKARNFCRQSFKFGCQFAWNDNFLKKAAQEFDLFDTAKIEQD